MRIGLGCDHHAFEMKEMIKRYLNESGHETVDYGCYSCEETDYPDIAFQVAQVISEGSLERGILLCGTGIGMAIAAGKFPGVRAALCHDTYSAERAQKSNNAQILTMGAKVIGAETAKKIVEAWVNSRYTGGQSARKIRKIDEKEKDILSRSMQ